MLNPIPAKRISSADALNQAFFDHIKLQDKEKKINESNYMEKVKANLLEYNSL